MPSLHHQKALHTPPPTKTLFLRALWKQFIPSLMQPHQSGCRSTSLLTIHHLLLNKQIFAYWISYDLITLSKPLLVTITFRWYTHIYLISGLQFSFLLNSTFGTIGDKVSTVVGVWFHSNGPPFSLLHPSSFVISSWAFPRLRHVKVIVF